MEMDRWKGVKEGCGLGCGETVKFKHDVTTNGCNRGSARRVFRSTMSWSDSVGRNNMNNNPKQ